MKLYISPQVTVDVVVFTIKDGGLKVLLLRRKRAPYKNSLTLPGGFTLKNETVDKTAKRVLKDKVGVKNVYLEQLYTFDGLKRDPRGHVLSVSYFALVDPKNVNSARKRSLKFKHGIYSVKSLPQLGFDHKSIVKYALKRLQYKLEYTNVAYSLLPENFTFSELQKVYEIILGRRLDKRNFRKKFMALGLVKPTGKQKSGARHRPAKMYKFHSQKPKELKKFF